MTLTKTQEFVSDRILRKHVDHLFDNIDMYIDQNEKKCAIIGYTTLRELYIVQLDYSKNSNKTYLNKHKEELTLKSGDTIEIDVIDTNSEDKFFDIVTTFISPKPFKPVHDKDGFEMMCPKRYMYRRRHHKYGSDARKYRLNEEKFRVIVHTSTDNISDDESGEEDDIISSMMILFNAIRTRVSVTYPPYNGIREDMDFYGTAKDIRAVSELDDLMIDHQIIAHGTVAGKIFNTLKLITIPTNDTRVAYPCINYDDEPF